MIHALDHIVVATGSLEADIAGYEVLLGRRVDRPDAGAGAVRASVQLDNVRFDLTATQAGANHGLSALAFAVADTAKARRLLERRALPVTNTGASRDLHIVPEATHHVPVVLVERAPGAGADASAPLAAAEAGATVSALDHVVIRSPNPERAVALYAGRLGLSLRLDRSEPAWGARLLFFRCGDLIVEVAHELKMGIGDGPDRLWGLSWRVPDITKVHARLRKAGVSVSDLRTGRRPRTRVFTAKSHAAGVPTLLLGMDPHPPAEASHG